MTKKIIITFRDNDKENKLFDFLNSKSDEIGGKSGYIKRILYEEFKKESK